MEHFCAQLIALGGYAAFYVLQFVTLVFVVGQLILWFLHYVLLFYHLIDNLPLKKICVASISTASQIFFVKILAKNEHYLTLFSIRGRTPFFYLTNKIRRRMWSNWKQKFATTFEHIIFSQLSINNHSADFSFNKTVVRNMFRSPINSFAQCSFQC